jgi:hypothetical protein
MAVGALTHALNCFGLTVHGSLQLALFRKASKCRSSGKPGLNKEPRSRGTSLESIPQSKISIRESKVSIRESKVTIQEFKVSTQEFKVSIQESTVFIQEYPSGGPGNPEAAGIQGVQLIHKSGVAKMTNTISLPRRMATPSAAMHVTLPVPYLLACQQVFKHHSSWKKKMIGSEALPDPRCVPGR